MSESERYSRRPVGSSSASTGSWLARIPIEPTIVLVETSSTSSSNTVPSGVSTSTGNFSCGTRGLLVVAGLAGVLDDLVDRPLEEERPLGQVVVLALEDLVEPADRLLDRDVHAGRAGELLRDEERQRQEQLGR